MHSVFLLAAGFGSRLRPLTNHRPKPLLPLMGRPMLDYALHHLQQAGHNSFLINAHHLWEQIAEWAMQYDIEVQVELPEILGTGGGLKAAAPKMSDKFLIWNGDIISDIDPTALLKSCPESGAGMALCYKENLNGTTRLLFTDDCRVTRIGNICVSDDADSLPTEPNGWHFSGIHALSKNVLGSVPDGFQCIIRSAYVDLIPKKKVQALTHRGLWIDTGTPPEYLKANLDALQKKYTLSIDPWKDSQAGFDGCWVHNKATILGNIQNSIIGENVTVPADADLDSCVVWDNATVPAGSYRHCIFHDGGILAVELDTN